MLIEATRFLRLAERRTRPPHTEVNPMKTTLVFGLAALVALTAVAVAPAASAGIDVDRCKSDYTPEFPQIDACVEAHLHVGVGGGLDPCVKVWIDDVGGPIIFCN